jgi:hypothetical protein
MAEFHYRSEVLLIVQPNIGSILCLTDVKEIEKPIRYVVIDRQRRSTGKNKNLIREIKLARVIAINNNMVTYDDEEIPLSLSLNNHSNWFNAAFIKKWHTDWENAVKETTLPISINIRLNSSTIKPDNQSKSFESIPLFGIDINQPVTTRTRSVSSPINTSPINTSPTTINTSPINTSPVNTSPINRSATLMKPDQK